MQNLELETRGPRREELKPVLKKSASAKSWRGSGKNRFGKSRQKIEKPRPTLKNTKYIHFFQNFKHIKQQQH
jgi:hypothetical protein